jgi:cysteinyl-tRNA synthetase
VHIEKDMVDHFEAMLQGIDDLLGLDLMTVHDVTAAEKDLIARREAARGRQDWAESDRLRDELAARGIGLHDHPHGVIWFPRSSPA